MSEVHNKTQSQIGCTSYVDVSYLAIYCYKQTQKSIVFNDFYKWIQLLDTVPEVV